MIGLGESSRCWHNVRRELQDRTADGNYYAFEQCYKVERTYQV
jgi:hypothetical protein